MHEAKDQWCQGDLRKKLTLQPVDDWLCRARDHCVKGGEAITHLAMPDRAALDLFLERVRDERACNSDIALTGAFYAALWTVVATLANPPVSLTAGAISFVVAKFQISDEERKETASYLFRGECQSQL
jgi:hypothetical protein